MFSAVRRMGVQFSHTVSKRVSLQTRFQSTEKSDMFIKIMKGLNYSNPSRRTSKIDQELLNVATGGTFGSSENMSNRRSTGLLKAGGFRNSPKAVADQLKVTGPIAGRIISVHKGDISTAYRFMRSLIFANNIRGEHMGQRFHMKPSKVLEMKRLKRKQKLFDQGIRRLVDLVKDAKRRGY